MHLRNIGQRQLDYTPLHPRRLKSSSLYMFSKNDRVRGGMTQHLVVSGKAEVVAFLTCIKFLESSNIICKHEGQMNTTVKGAELGMGQTVGQFFVLRYGSI